MKNEPVKKKCIALIFGGPSREHGVSCLSALNLWKCFPRKKYRLLALGWDQKGTFHLSENIHELLELNTSSPLDCVVHPQKDEFSLRKGFFDMAFPIVHGNGGEDGHLQKMLERLNLPYVGSKPETCHNTWHKGLCKSLLNKAGLPVLPGRLFEKGNLKTPPPLDDYPLFVKPACGGSSFGVSRVTNEKGFLNALEKAWKESREALVEEECRGRELECALLNGQASPVGEVICHEGFYDFEAKYLLDSRATPSLYPHLPESLEKHIRNLALRAGEALACDSFCRVDFFLRNDGEIFINEINTYPGFTDISMYPKLWEKAGLSPPQLVEALLEGAFRNSA
jgi:D-alanine-D-alanine ligase